jgi:hypothetical protein
MGERRTCVLSAGLRRVRCVLPTLPARDGFLHRVPPNTCTNEGPMTNRTIYPTLIFAMASSACGSSSTGPTTTAPATGTVAGIALEAHDAFFVNSSVTTGTVVGITSFSGACETLYTNDRLPGSSAVLSLQLVSYTDGGAAGPVTAPGTFSLLPSLGTNEFGAEWTSVDASCVDTTISATGGSVTVTDVSASELTGSFDLTFGADHITGSFSASECPAAGTPHSDPTCS